MFCLGLLAFMVLNLLCHGAELSSVWEKNKLGRLSIFSPSAVALVVKKTGYLAVGFLKAFINGWECDTNLDGSCHIGLFLLTPFGVGRESTFTEGSFISENREEYCWIT